MSGNDSSIQQHAGPTLSVIVPVYNVEEEYLYQCLDSIDAQSFKDFELILVDDGAGSKLAAILDKWCKKHTYAKAIHQVNRGVAAARNAGLALCSGKYVTFIDSDDTVTADNFEKVIARAERDSLDVLMWGLYRCYGEDKIPFSPYLADIDVFDRDRIREAELKCMVGTLPSFKSPASADAAGSACAKLYRLDFLNENNLRYTEGLKRAEDMLFNLEVFGRAGRIGYLYDFYYNYRQLDSSATYIYRENGISVFTDTLKHMKQYLVSEGKSDYYMQVYYMRCMFFLLESMDMDYNNPSNPNGYLARRHALAAAAGSDPYKEAIANLKLNNLVFARKIPLILIRCRMFGLLMLFYKLYGKLIGKK